MKLNSTDTPLHQQKKKKTTGKCAIDSIAQVAQCVSKPIHLPTLSEAPTQTVVAVCVGTVSASIHTENISSDSEHQSKTFLTARWV